MPHFDKLTGRDVHIWPVSLPISAPGPDLPFLPFLSPDERERVARFQFERHRRAFTVARGALRVLLGHYLDTSPGGISFEYGPRGKPKLLEPARVKFNVSHSGELAVFAFTLDGELGIDIEHVRPMPDMREIAVQYFCEEEAEELMALPDDVRERAFFLCWTRKEAYIKAMGDGLSTALNAFRVTLRPDEPARFIHLERDLDVAGKWTLHDLNLNPHYAAALAYRDEPRPILPQPLIELAELVFSVLPKR
ncbi:MAG: 4'-phosphopantetheinyl transferase superfamily protein [Acidobacteriota bacterium]|nr:4'-phosphopantetheinyl transferase superfamily protein [Acidobacteriota bacterium]